ncbi:MAG: hypothetical protein DRI69_07510 [Bacteroidetes bacterium]|nr:MAG: hypothetical protein DRI69_07510 [Bacteroidota bacterium]
MKNSYLLIALVALIFTLGCTGQKNTAKKSSTEENSIAPLNPNGDSELALLMRSMYDDGMEMKLAINNGEIPESHIDISKMRTSEPSVAGKADTPEYQAYTLAYEAAFKGLKEAQGDQKTQAYETLVNTCIACHRSECPGPIVRIEKMKL